MLPKLAQVEQNWIIFTPYGFIRNLWQIHFWDSHRKFWEKIELGILILMGNTVLQKYYFMKLKIFPIF